MRHAVAALLLLAATPLVSLAAGPQGTVEGIGMIAYSDHPKFKVGDWVRYRTTATSEQGFKADYTVTMLIAGEELWWGEKCFWVETQTSYSGNAPEITASLISYSVFEDSLPNRHFQKYIRKFYEGVDDQGNPIQQPFLRAMVELKTRGFEYTEPPRTTDTLGRETIETPKGKFVDALKDIQKSRQSTNSQEADSTVYFEQSQEHTRWWSDQVPLTHLVKIRQEHTQKRRAWMPGESEKAPLVVMDYGVGGSEVVDYGTGMKAEMVPEAFRRPLAEQMKPPPAKKPAATTTKKTAARS